MKNKQQELFLEDPMHRLLEVEVNGEHTFVLAQDPLVNRCGRLAKIIRGTTILTACRVNALRVAFHDLPGGPQAFELAARFCYWHSSGSPRGGGFHITAANVSLLRCIAEYMEMTEEFSPRNLIKETENFLQNLVFWSWNEVLLILRSCEPVLPYAEKTHIVHRCVESLAWKASTISSTCQSPTSSTSPDSSSNQSSSANNKRLSRTWWFDDVCSLSMYLMERIVKAMISNNMDNRILARFLVHYVQTALPTLGYHSHHQRSTASTTRDEHILQKYTQKVQRELLETVIALLGHLDHGSAPCSSLFGLLRVTSALNSGRSCRKQLEKMIGHQLDKASLDDIVIPLRPTGSGSLYDVDLVLRLIDRFLSDQDIFSEMTFPTPINGPIMASQPPSGTSFRRALTKFEHSLTKVADLIDKYLVEIAADPQLKPFKFKSVAKALPDSARLMHDGLYRALDLYLQVSVLLSSVSESETMELCKVVNYQKLSFEGCKHAAQNPRFPARLALQILLLQQAKLRDTIDHCFFKEGLRVSDSSRYKEAPVPAVNHPSAAPSAVDQPSPEFGLIIRQNEELKSDINKMQAKVSELEKLCKRMRSDMSSRRTRRLLC
ncbi:root phototropism protein 3 [Selaginella moellendorffii]|uniref:root phototropism protein 3 n=1 Tax=Selaginella moellendorffii TaxID=88036 RepID=UPI000D1C869C|nr:root phototropism protein 3 [Selaginella moellendorffii]|eukprot:XP_024515530.1 root phototropism protein 3 [Selaginella moellendorffii]